MALLRLSFDKAQGKLQLSTGEARDADLVLTDEGSALHCKPRHHASQTSTPTFQRPSCDEV